MKKTRKTASAIASMMLGFMLAIGISLVTPAEVLADGNCAPQQSWVCGLNGVNYNNKFYVTNGQ